jgi:hypothetical protein
MAHPPSQQGIYKPHRSHRMRRGCDKSPSGETMRVARSSMLYSERLIPMPSQRCAAAIQACGITTAMKASISIVPSNLSKAPRSRGLSAIILRHALMLRSFTVGLACQISDWSASDASGAPRGIATSLSRWGQEAKSSRRFCLHSGCRV